MKFKDLRTIVIVLKKLLEYKDLNEPYRGGLSSYSLVLMITSFLNICDAHNKSKNLSEFLNFYGNYFDPLKTYLDGNQYYNFVISPNE